MTQRTNVAVSMRDISKRFGSLQALTNVTFDVQQGEIVALFALLAICVGLTIGAGFQNIAITAAVVLVYYTYIGIGYSCDHLANENALHL